jgi:predicted phosphate transport protein (TIGR00153 family)
MLFKKKDFFFATLILSAQNLKEASELFLEEINNLHAVEDYAKRIKDLEVKGDDYTHDIIHALNKTFITPLEREDILGLATKIDDVIDGIEECADRLCLYQVKQADEYIVAFAENIVKNCHEIVAAMALLEQKKLPEMMQHVFRINELENEADSLLRVCIRNLFEKTDDPILIIKKMQLYDMLERITDVCEDVADILESLQMRNS